MTLRRLTAAVLLIAGLSALGEAGWIRGKAALSQILLARSWQRAAAGVETPRPWPWADTWPIARLIVPELGVRTIVLSGASMRNLAFGPAHFDGTPRPGASGNAVIAGHRDTHFRFLAELEAGDEVHVETIDDGVHRFVVTGTRVIAADDRSILRSAEAGELTLVTCYPPSGVRRADRRYAVHAEHRGRVG